MVIIMIKIMIVITKLLLIIAVVIMINSLFQPGYFSTGSTIDWYFGNYSTFTS